MANTLEITPVEIGLQVNETISIPVTTDADSFEFTNDAENVVVVKEKKGKLLFKGLIKGAANVVVTAGDAEPVRLVVTVLEKEESGTVYFHSNGGKGSMASQTLAVNETFSLPNSQFEAPKGKEFIGWSEEPDGSSGIKGVNELLQFHQTGEHTIYAIYADKPELPDPVEPEPEPEPEPDPEPGVKPEAPKDEYLSEDEIAKLLKNIETNWNTSLAKIANEGHPKYKAIISKLSSFEDRYGKNGRD